MRKRSIGNDQYIIQHDNKYYVVNEYTFDLLNAYFENTTIGEMARVLNRNSFSLRRELHMLRKEIQNIEYYDDNISLDFPLKVQWKVTNRCNLHCKHCYLGDLDFTELPRNDLMKIADRIIDSNVLEVTITGGEALVVASLPEIVAKLLKNDIKVNIFTNAILLDSFSKKLEKELGMIPSKQLDFFISVDGDEKTHDFIRGKGNYRKTIRNIQKMIDKGYRITTNSVLSRMNYLQIPELYRTLYQMGVYKIQISNLIDSGNATSDMKLDIEEHKVFMEKLREVLSSLDSGAKLLYAEMPDEGESSEVFLLGKDGQKHLQKEQWKCSAGIGKCTIDYNGNVFCCPFITEYCLGNLLQEDFATVWSSKKRFQFLKLIAKENNNSRVCLAVKRRMER